MANVGILKSEERSLPRRVTAILKTARSLEDETHRGDLDYVKKIVVVEILMSAKAGQLNAISGNANYNACNNPVSVFLVNVRGMNRRSKKRNASSNRKHREIP